MCGSVVGLNGDADEPMVIPGNDWNLDPLLRPQPFAQVWVSVGWQRDDRHLRPPVR